MKFYHSGSGRKFTRICEAIEWTPDEHHMISFVGAGGKTTFIYAMAEELKEMGYRVIITTTTHMAKPEHDFRECPLISALNPGESITVGTDCKNGKIAGPHGTDVKDLLSKADVVLVEADGSRRKPLKVPAAHEPVIPKGTDLLIGVLGYNSVGNTIEEVSHRAKDVAAFLQKETKDIVTVQDIQKISFDRRGLLKDVACPYRIVWNRWRKEEIDVGTGFSILFCEEE